MKSKIFIVGILIFALSLMGISLKEEINCHGRELALSEAQEIANHGLRYEISINQTYKNAKLVGSTRDINGNWLFTYTYRACSIIIMVDRCGHVSTGGESAGCMSWSQ